MSVADFVEFLVAAEPGIEALVRQAFADYQAQHAEIGAAPPLDGEAKVNAAVDAELAKAK